MTNKAEQFSQYLDGILGHAPVPREAQVEINQRERYFIHILATSDFSSESQVRQSLRRKLLSKGKESTMNSLVPHKPYHRLTLMGILLALILLAASPMGNSLAQSIIDIVQTWKLGNGSTAVSVGGDFVAIPNENGEIVIQPAPAGGLDEPSIEELVEDGSPALDTNLPFEQAAELISFKLRKPDSDLLPEGYEFQGVTVVNAEKVQMDYLKFEDTGLIGLGQTVVGGINGEVQVTFSSDMTTIDVKVNGQDGLWISPSDGSGMLMWEADGINYQLQLMGVGDLDLALRIAESLE